MSPFGILTGIAPPGVERDEAILRAAQRPIQLRSDVIQPSLAEPAARVCIDLVIGIETRDSRGMTRPPDTERADADEDTRTDLLHALVDRLDEVVDVRAPPGVAAAEASRL